MSALLAALILASAAPAPGVPTQRAGLRRVPRPPRPAPALHCDAALVLGAPAAPAAAAIGPASAAAPACIGEVCQPRVAVPGFEPRFREKRADLLLRLLSRSPLPPIASLAGAIAQSNLRLDFQPGAIQTSPARTPGGWGRVVVSLRWRLDAENSPVE